MTTEPRSLVSARPGTLPDRPFGVHVRMARWKSLIVLIAIPLTLFVTQILVFQIGIQRLFAEHLRVQSERALWYERARHYKDCNDRELDARHIAYSRLDVVSVHEGYVIDIGT